MKKTAKPNRSSADPSTALHIAVIALAPFLGGKDEIVQTGAVSSVAVLAAAAILLRNRLQRPAAVWAFGVFLGLLVVSAFFTASLHATIEQVLYFASCVGIAISASVVFRDRTRLIYAAVAVAAVGLFVSAMGVTEYIQAMRSLGPGWRVFGPFVSPGFLGGYLVLVIPVTIAVFLSARSLPVLVGSVLGIGFEVAALLLTGARFAAVSAVVAGFALLALLVWAKTLKRTHLLRVGFAILIIAVAASLAAYPMMHRVVGAQAAEQAYSGGFRVATWKGMLGIIKAHPLIGTGAGTFALVFPKYTIAGPTANAHNSYLQIASETGLPALIAVSVAFVAIFVGGARGLRNRKNENDQPKADNWFLLPDGDALIVCGSLAALVGSVVRNLLDSDLHSPAIGFTFWMLAGMVASVAPTRQAVSLKPYTRAVLGLVAGCMITVWMLFSLGALRNVEANAAWKNDEPLAALELYESAIAVDPLSADHWLGLGVLRTRLAGSKTAWEEGISNMERAIALEPTRAKSVIMLADALAVKGNRERAVREYERALELDPHATPAMLSAARILSESKKTLPQAERMYQRMIDQEASPVETLRGVPELVNPDYAFAHAYFAEKARKEGNWQDAALHYRAIVRRLDERESYSVQRLAAEAVGMVDPAKEEVLANLRVSSKAALAEAEQHLKSIDNER